MTQKQDMALMNRIFIHKSSSAEDIYSSVPLTFSIGGIKMKGIPNTFERSFEREITDANIVRYTYTGLCREYNLKLKVTHWEYRDFPVSEWVAEFINIGNTDTPVISDIMFGGVIKGEFKCFVHGNGDTCTEDGYEWFRDELKNGEMTVSPKDGTTCNGAFPYMKLVFDDCVCRVAVGWPQMWKASVTRTEDGVEYACGQKRCHMVIHSGETMRSVRLTMMITDGDEARSRNMWRRWYMKHILPRQNGKPVEPAMYLHYWSCENKPEHTAATEENQVEALKEYVDSGLTPDIWWIDAGWYKCDYDWWQIGTWKPDAQRFPNGLAPIGKTCEKFGVRFLLWFEPERVMPGSELHEEHHDWLIPVEDESDGHKGNHLLNLGNREACDWITNRVDQIIKEGHISVYRQDFNFDPKPCWEKTESGNRIGAVENLHVQGYLRYWDELLFRNPGLLIDSCAAGGRRNEMETMRRAVPLHYTDVGYGKHEIKQKQFREMFEWIPYFRSHNMSWDTEAVKCMGKEWTENDEFSFQNAMAPAVTYMTWYNAPEEQKKRTIKAEKIWRRAARLMLDGDYYPLTECKKSVSDWYACQFDDFDKGRGFIQLIRNYAAEDDTFTVFPKVCDGKRYVFENSNTGEFFEKTSAELKNEGFLTALEKRSGVVFFYEIL